MVKFYLVVSFVILQAMIGQLDCYRVPGWLNAIIAVFDDMAELDYVKNNAQITIQ